MMLSKDDLLGVVASDLRYLRTEWNESIDDAALRRGSAVLRRLLVDGELQRAWRTAGLLKEPMVTCSTLKPILASVPIKRLSFAAAGGARYKGAELRGFMMTDLVMSAEQAKIQAENGLPEEVVGLKTFVESATIVVAGQIVVRRVLIKYVANKLGGAHHDSKRGTSHEEQLFGLLDTARSQIKLLDKPFVYFELLAIGQSVARASDIERFCKLCERNNGV
jgi:hypothetical protein